MFILKVSLKRLSWMFKSGRSSSTLNCLWAIESKLDQTRFRTPPPLFFFTEYNFFYNLEFQFSNKTQWLKSWLCYRFSASAVTAGKDKMTTAVIPSHPIPSHTHIRTHARTHVHILLKFWFIGMRSVVSLSLDISCSTSRRILRRSQANQVSYMSNMSEIFPRLSS